jgi:hypothetical protein
MDDEDLKITINVRKNMKMEKSKDAICCTYNLPTNYIKFYLDGVLLDLNKNSSELKLNDDCTIMWRNMYPYSN